MKIIRQINVEDDDDDDDDISPPPPPPGSPPPPPVYPAAYPAGYPPSGYVYPQPAAYAGKCIEFLKNYLMFHFSCVVFLCRLCVFTIRTDFVQNNRKICQQNSGIFCKIGCNLV